MRSDATAPSTFPDAALRPHGSSARTGPVTVAVGHAVDSTLRAGAVVARQFGCGIAVISVIEPAAIYLWNTPGVPVPSSFEEERSLARWGLLEEQMRTVAERNPPWSIEVLWGGVPRTVAHAARDLRSPCIVMGIGRHQPIDRLLGAETALRTVRHADCPVLAVTPTFVTPPETVVVGVDFSDASVHAVRAVLPLLAPEAALHLVHAWQPSGSHDEHSVEADERYRRELPDHLASFVAQLDPPAGVTLHTEVESGRPAERLLAVAESRDADLLVVGRHGRGLLERLLVGSVATRVLRGATCSVLVVPEPPPAARMQLAERRGATMRGVPRDGWRAFFDQFTRRFAGRIVALDATDPARGFHARERGFVLFGTSFDPETGAMEIILGEANGRRRHLTRVIPDASNVAALLGPDGVELGVHIVHGTGDTLLTVLPVAEHGTS